MIINNNNNEDAALWEFCLLINQVQPEVVKWFLIVIKYKYLLSFIRTTMAGSNNYDYDY